MSTARASTCRCCASASTWGCSTATPGFRRRWPRSPIWRAACAGLRRELESLRQDERERARRIDLLTYQVQEIQAAKLQDGEPAELDAERRRLANAEQLAQLSAEALQLLQESDGERLAVLDAVGSIEQALSRLARIDPGVRALAEQLEQAGALLDDLARELGRYGEEIEFNPRRLAQVEERLHLIHTCSANTATRSPRCWPTASRAAAELETISHAGERIEALEAEEATCSANWAAGRGACPRRGATAGERIGRAIEAELADLQMARRALRRADRAGRPNPTARSWTPNPRPRPAEPARPLRVRQPRAGRGRFPRLRQPRRAAAAAGEGRVRRRNLAADAGAQDRARPRRRDADADLRRDRPGDRRPRGRDGGAQAVGADQSRRRRGRREQGQEQGEATASSFSFQLHPPATRSSASPTCRNWPPMATSHYHVTKHIAGERTITEVRL